MILGVTGQTGSGKTTVLDAVAELGGFVIDCDALYWELLKENKRLVVALTHEFHEITHPVGEIDRKKLGAQVFGNPERLERLNQIAHPFILEKVDELVKKADEKGHTIIAIDAIALIESGLGEKCDKIIAIVADRETRISRIMKRDDISREYAINRVNAQQETTFYEKNSDFILENHFPSRDVFLQYAKQQIKTI